MTLPLTDSEIDYAKRLAAMESDSLAPAKGIMVGMLLGAAIWLILGIIIYFTFFN